MTTAEIQASPEALDTNSFHISILDNYVEVIEEPIEETSPFVAYLESKRNIYDEVAGDDKPGKNAVEEYRNVLDLLSISQGGDKEPISLSELCIDCTTTEKLADSLIDRFLRGIPDVKITSEDQGGMLRRLYEFQDDASAVNPRLRARVCRVEHDFIEGKRRAYYSLTRGSV
jgi:hypothetical protein